MCLLQKRIITKDIIDNGAEDFYNKFYLGNSLKDNINILKTYEEFVLSN